MSKDRGGVAQRLEQRAHNLLVAGSIPATPTIIVFYSGFVVRYFLFSMQRAYAQHAVFVQF